MTNRSPVRSTSPQLAKNSMQSEQIRPLRRVLRRVRLLWESAISYLLKFGVVGLAGYVVDISVFNLLRVGALGGSHFLSGPIGANIISVAASTLVTWIGNRYWTFREHRRKNILSELFEFTVVALAGLLISMGCLWISHYALGLTSLLADNISKNVVGLALGTAFRFALYRYWVYGHHRKHGLVAKTHKAEAAAKSIFEDDVTASERPDPE